jgi:hypothetical protein
MRRTSDIRATSRYVGIRPVPAWSPSDMWFISDVRGKRPVGHNRPRTVRRSNAWIMAAAVGDLTFHTAVTPGREKAVYKHGSG